MVKCEEKVYSDWTETHGSLLEKAEQILNRPITKFYNIEDVNAIAAELRRPKTRPIGLLTLQKLLYYTNSDRCK